MADALKAMTAFGLREPKQVKIGALSISELTDVALASVAARKGRMADLERAAGAAGLPLPGPSTHVAGNPYSTFWVAPEMWLVEAPFATHELIADMLRAALGDGASVTEQTDAWVGFDLAAPDLTALMQRLCNVDFATVADGHATRTVMEHLGVYLIKRGKGAARIYGPRSSAESLLHSVEGAAIALA